MSLSACVTRILSLSGFPAELKTRDIQAAFSQFEGERGGFKIKWLDDTSLLIVFADPQVAKKAYLSSLLSPPPQFTSPTSDTPALLRPYDGPDAQNVIAAVNSRANGHRARPSISTATTGTSGTVATPGQTGGLGHARRDSRGWKKSSTGTVSVDVNGSANSLSMPIPITSPLAREPSPTLPSLPSHPTLGSLISSTLPELKSQDTAVAS